MSSWIDLGGRIAVASQGEDGPPRVYPDEAVAMAATMVAIALSEATVVSFRTAYVDAEAAAKTLNKIMRDIYHRMDGQNANSTKRSAEIYAAAFGVRQN